MIKNSLKVALSILIAGLLIPATPITVSALDYNALDAEVVNISSLSAGDQVIVAEGTSVTLTGTGSDIQVICSTGSSLTLDNVSITNSAISCSAITFIGDNCELTFTGTNSLVAGNNSAGINTSRAEVTINGTGTLTATGGILAAGIGGGNGESSGVITINGGALIAKGGAGFGSNGGGAGVGGGNGGTGGTVTINGGNLTVTGGLAAAGIGGGKAGNGGVIAINGGVLTATSGLGGAGIGGGSLGNGGAITINGGTITAKSISERTRRQTSGAGVGGGSGADGGMITINGGTVTASSEVQGSGIGGGYIGNGGTIIINGGTVNATGGQYAAGIGGGFTRSGGAITITGGTVNATGGPSGGAGIGGGYISEDCGIISISGGIVNAKGIAFAGIGSRRSSSGRIHLSGGEIFCDSSLSTSFDDISVTAGAFEISDTAAVFLRNDTCITPQAISYTHATYSAISTLDGIDIPSGWTTFGTYINYSTISYDLNLGNGVTPSSVTQRAGTATTVAAIDGISRTGFVFDSWNTESSGSGSVYAPGDVITIGSDDTTLYAKWRAPAGGTNGNRNRDSEKPGSTAVFIDGKPENSGRTELSNVGGKIVASVTLDDTKIRERLNAEGNNPTVSISIGGSADVREGVLNGQTVKNMEEKVAVLEIKTSSATYTLPASEINIDGVSAQIGTQVQLKDIKVSIRIAEPPNDTVRILEDTANKNMYQLIIKPVEFEITCTSGNKTVTVSKFNGYVERTVSIPDGIDPSKITTGIVLNPDGTFSHVPTTIMKIDGKYYAKINSLTNSTYSVIYNPIEFADVAKHWAKDSVNNMGSRLIVGGSGNGNYSPDKEITRAEFAAIIIRALGLKAGMGDNTFADVDSTDWYCGYTETAVSYGIISGYNTTNFRPNDKITREQAMAMIARAMKLTALAPNLTDSNVRSLLADYTDAAKASSYAKAGIAACLDTGVVSGRSDSTIAPKDNITRAEVAVIVERLLKNSKLI